MKKKEGLSRLLEIAGEKKKFIAFLRVIFRYKCIMYTYTILVYI